MESSKPKLTIPLSLTVAIVATLSGCAPDPYEGLDCTVPDSGCQYDYSRNTFEYPDGAICNPPRPDPRCYS